MFSGLNLVPAFEDLHDEYMDLLKPLFEPFSCQAGSIVVQQGTPADYLYLILSGQVEMSFKPYDGGPITVSHAEKGGWFGWSAVVGSRKYTSSALAIDTRHWPFAPRLPRLGCATSDFVVRLMHVMCEPTGNVYITDGPSRLQALTCHVG